MEKPREIPDGFEWIDADPVGAMLCGDQCTSSQNGVRYELVQYYFPCERTLTFRAIGPTSEIIELPLSKASEIMRPDENRVEGMGVLEPVRCGEQYEIRDQNFVEIINTPWWKRWYWALQNRLT